MGYFETYGNIARQSNDLSPEDFKRFGVKVGLRNEDGTGVLVGLTRISSVVGYEKTEDRVIPVPGRLIYRGHDVEELVSRPLNRRHLAFEESAFLLYFGHLPSAAEFELFLSTLGDMRDLPLNFCRDVLMTFRTRNIMNALGRAILTLYSIDENPEELSLGNQVRQAMTMLARFGTLTAYSYHAIQQAFHGRSLYIHAPDPKLSTAENFLRLLRPAADFTELEARTLDVCLVLHADHGGGNNSTFSTRVLTSTLTDFYSAVGAAVGSLKGPLHGGANQKVVEMMDDLRAQAGPRPTREAVRAYLLALLSGAAFDRLGKIYGLGHAVYTLTDPRTLVLRDYARRLAEEKGRVADFELYAMVEELAPDVFQEHKRSDRSICVNVDFYSGFVYECLGIPREVFTPLFAIARVAGWAAHRLEVLSNPVKIMRPAFRTL
ncbi:MAG: citrate synthase [Deltaproteobacteria bacterium]|nr:citrate synthase [Deltaproteobacteria bacterium]